MRALAVVLALMMAVCSPATAQQPPASLGNFINAYLEGDRLNRPTLNSYFSGIYHGLIIANAAVVDAEFEPLFCVPDYIDADALMALTASILLDSEGDPFRNLSVAGGVFLILAVYFPC